MHPSSSTNIVIYVWTRRSIYVERSSELSWKQHTPAVYISDASSNIFLLLCTLACRARSTICSCWTVIWKGTSQCWTTIYRLHSRQLFNTLIARWPTVDRLVTLYDPTIDNVVDLRVVALRVPAWTITV